MYIRLLKLVGVNIIQGVLISGAVMVGKRIVRKVKIKHATKKYDKACDEYKDRTEESANV